MRNGACLAKRCTATTAQRVLQTEAINLAKQADVIVAAMGESAEMSGESSSRTELEIPATQQQLLQELLKLGKPVVLVLFNGRPLVLNQENETVPAILDVWFREAKPDMQ
jgi:beta-glucosidase